MDSNVSKNTNSHNFFKIGLNQQKLGISIKNLLKQELLSIVDLYQQKFNVQTEQNAVAGILADKIAISSYQQISVRPQNNRVNFLPAKFSPIIYSCPLGLSLAASWQQTPQSIMQELIHLMTSTADDSNQNLSDELLVEAASTGWLNFHLDAKFIAQWLERMLLNRQVQIGTEQQERRVGILSGDLAIAELFFAQYIHARCCSLLRLGTREKLISFSGLAADLEKASWQAEQPSSISWLDEQGDLWLGSSSEVNLIKQLLIVTDAWQENHLEAYWSKLALSLSQSAAIFLAECRFLGQVKQKYPQKAIARLGLIALIQFWLEKMLREKLEIAAPQEI